MDANVLLYSTLRYSVIMCVMAQVGETVNTS